MNNYKTVKFKTNNLSKILEKNYEEIYKSIEKENYIIEYNSFYEFREILFEDKTVGFLTLDTFMPTNVNLCLNEVYILPQYRGNDLLIGIIHELLQDKNITVYIRKPNYAFIKFLIKNELAFEISPNIAVSHVKFVVKVGEYYSNKNIKKLYHSKRFIDNDFVYYANGFHMDFCSVFFFDKWNEIVKIQAPLVFTNPRKEDVKTHSSRKKLHNLTESGIIKIYNIYKDKQDLISEFNEKLKNRLNENNEEKLVYEKDGEIVVRADLTSNDFLKIQKATMREESKGNLTSNSGELRIEYLLNNIDKLDKTVNLSKIKGNAKHLVVCPFCGEYCKKDTYCKKCGQIVTSLFKHENSNPFSLKNVMKRIQKINQENQNTKYNLNDKIADHCITNGYDIKEVYETQKKITIYETIKYISKNKIYFNIPSYSYYNHINTNCFEEEWACKLGYLRKISDEEFINRVHNEYTYEDLVNEVEIDGMKFNDEEMEKHIYNLKTYTDQWMRPVYEVTQKGLNFIESSKSMEIFSKYLSGFIYYEFEEYYKRHDDLSDLEICDGFIKQQYEKLDKLELIRFYKNYLFYKIRIYKQKDNCDELIIKILQLAIYEVNITLLKEDYYMIPFDNKTSKLFKYITDIDKYYDKAFDEFKLDLLKSRKDDVYKYIKDYLNGEKVSIYHKF